MSFKNKPTLRERRGYFFTDQGSMRATPSTKATCADPGADCGQAEDAGRIRFAKTPESNHYAGGGWNDQEEYPRGGSGGHDPVNQRALNRAMGIPSNAASGSAGADPSQRPPVNSTRVGNLGTPVNESKNDLRTGLTGTAAYDPRTNLSTVGKDPSLLGNNTSGGVGGMSPQGMTAKAAATRDLLKRINRKNRKFYARDADKPDPDDEDDEAGDMEKSEREAEQQPEVTRHTLTKEAPDGSVHVQRWERESHPAPMPKHVETVDIRNPRRQPVLPGTHDSAGNTFGTLRAKSIRHASDTLAAMNKANRERYGK